MMWRRRGVVGAAGIHMGAAKTHTAIHVTQRTTTKRGLLSVNMLVNTIMDMVNMGETYHVDLPPMHPIQARGVMGTPYLDLVPVPFTTATVTIMLLVTMTMLLTHHKRVVLSLVCWEAALMYTVMITAIHGHHMVVGRGQWVEVGVVGVGVVVGWWGVGGVGVRREFLKHSAKVHH